MIENRTGPFAGLPSFLGAFEMIGDKRIFFCELQDDCRDPDSWIGAQILANGTLETVTGMERPLVALPLRRGTKIGFALGGLNRGDTKSTKVI